MSSEDTKVLAAAIPVWDKLPAWEQNNLIYLRHWWTDRDVPYQRFILNYNKVDPQRPCSRELYFNYNFYISDTLDGINKFLAIMPEPENCFWPLFSPDLGVVVMASEFGAKTEFPDDGNTSWVREVAFRSLDGLAAMTVPNPDTAGLLPVFYEKLDYLCRHVPPEYPVGMGGTQGPINELTLICDFETLIRGFYEAPDIMHHALDVLAQNAINVCNKMNEIRRHSRWHWWDAIGSPDDRINNGIANCATAAISPAIYEEFLLPADKKIFAGCRRSCSTMHVDWPAMPYAGLFARIPEIDNCNSCYKENKPDFEEICRRVRPDQILELWNWENFSKDLPNVVEVCGRYALDFQVYEGFKDIDGAKKLLEMRNQFCRRSRGRSEGSTRQAR